MVISSRVAADCGKPDSTAIVTVTVRYSYIISDRIIGMSQMLTKPRIHSSGLIQDVCVFKDRPYIQSSTSPASCYVCGRDLMDGRSLTAKTIEGETVMLCNVHVSRFQDI